jgi:hypothetical protein
MRPRLRVDLVVLDHSVGTSTPAGLMLLHVLETVAGSCLTWPLS